MVGHKRLVYPHIKGGRVVYLSGRTIGEKWHYNLPEVLAGERQPYYSYEYAPSEKDVVIVEGQADAISLAQWGIPALALAGVTPGEGLQEALKRHQVVYVGLDADEAGQKNAWKVAEAIGSMVRLVSWHNTGFSSWADGEGRRAREGRERSAAVDVPKGPGPQRADGPCAQDAGECADLCGERMPVGGRAAGGSQGRSPAAGDRGGGKAG